MVIKKNRLLKTIDLDECESMQKRTFTKWINFHLHSHSSSGQVTDLFSDLRDGVLLCHLVEVLTGDALRVIKYCHDDSRVHHLSNLTTAFSALRHHKMELANNNPADIVDGNPHIILKLVWQMILHFQVEKNLRILHQFEYYYANEAAAAKVTSIKLSDNTPDQPSTSAETVDCRLSLFDKPAEFSGIVTPQSESLPLKVSQTKSSAERRLLKWINDEISRVLPDIFVKDFSESWLDGVAFCALLHRFFPPLINMESVKHKNSSAANLSVAFETARLHLNIRPLLEVDDFLQVDHLPDKHCVIAYVSQFLCFILPPKVEDTKSSAIAVASAVPLIFSVNHSFPEELEIVYPYMQWLYNLMSEQRFLSVIDDVEEDDASDDVTENLADSFTWVIKKRMELINNRMVYQSITQSRVSNSKSSNQMRRQLSEWEKDWQLAAYYTHKLNQTYVKRILSTFPTFNEFFLWMNEGEHFICSLVGLDANGDVVERHLDLLHLDTSMEHIEHVICCLEQHFDSPPHRRAIFTDAINAAICQARDDETLADKARHQRVEMLIMLQRRFDVLSEHYRLAMHRLLLLQAYYRLSAFLADLNTKIRMWQTANGRVLAARWLKEYTTKVETEHPEIRLESLLHELSCAISTDNVELSERGKKMYITSEQNAKETIRRFFVLGDWLQESLRLWKRFEELEAELLRSIVSQSESKRKKLALAECNRIVERFECVSRIQSQQAIGRSASDRLVQLRSRLSATVVDVAKEIINQSFQRSSAIDSDKASSPALKRQILTELVQSEKKGRRSIEEDVNLIPRAACDREFMGWLEDASIWLTKKARMAKHAEDILEQLSKLGRFMKKTEQNYQLTLRDSHYHRPTQNVERLNLVFDNYKKVLPKRITDLRELLPMLAITESNLLGMQHWMAYNDLESEIGVKSITERASIIERSDASLQYMENQHNDCVDLAYLKGILKGIRESYALVEIHQIEITIEVIETKVLTTKCRRRRTSTSASQSPPQQKPQKHVAQKELISEKEVKSQPENSNLMAEYTEAMDAERKAAKAVIDELFKSLERMSSLFFPVNMPDSKKQNVEERMISLKKRTDAKKTGNDDKLSIRGEELLRRKESIILRSEVSEQVAKSSMVEMALINNAIRIYFDVRDSNKDKKIALQKVLQMKNQALEERWLRKSSDLDKLLLIITEIRKVEHYAAKYRSQLIRCDAQKIVAFNAELEGIERALNDENHLSSLNIPLLEQTRVRITSLRASLLRLRAVDRRIQHRESIRHRLSALERSGEDDLSIASQIVQEIIDEIISVSQQKSEPAKAEPPLSAPSFSSTQLFPSSDFFGDIDENFNSFWVDIASYAQRIDQAIFCKMEFFQHLKQFHDRLESVRQSCEEHNSISSSQIREVSEKLNQLLSECRGELTEKLDFLLRESETMRDEFLPSEYVRIHQKCTSMSDDLSHLIALVEIRRTFLISLCEYQNVTEKCETAIIHAGKVQHDKGDMSLMMDELNKLRNELHSASNAVIIQQEMARMNVSDLRIEDAIRKLHDIIIPSVSYLDFILQRVRSLQNSLNQPLPEFNFMQSTQDGETENVILLRYSNDLLEIINSEAKQLSDLRHYDVKDSHNVENANLIASVVKLSERFTERSAEFKERVENAILTRMELLHYAILYSENELDKLASSGASMNRCDLLLALNSLEEHYLCNMVERIASIESDANDTRALIKIWNIGSEIVDYASKFDELRAMVKKIESRLKKEKSNLARCVRQEERLVKNLVAFDKWLQSMDNEVDETLSSNLNLELKQNKLSALRDNCLYHSKIVDKLQSYSSKFTDQEHTVFAIDCCRRYRILINRINQLNFSSINLVSVTMKLMTTDIGEADSDAQRCSQWSIASSSVATASQNDSDLDDLDSDLSSIRSELMRNESIQIANADQDVTTSSISPLLSTSLTPLLANRESREKTTKKIIVLVTALREKNNTSVISQLIQLLKSVLHSSDTLYQQYHPAKPLKSLSEACNAFSTLKSYIKQLQSLKPGLKKSLELFGDEENEKKMLKLIKHLKRAKTKAKKFYRQLSNEIDDETALRLNYRQILIDLNILETEVQTASQSGQPPNAANYLSKIELEIELLKKQCRQPRLYVEISIGGSRSSSPSRRNKIILKITNTVTTIINVIEEELRRCRSSNNLIGELPSTSSSLKTFSGFESEAEFVNLREKLFNLNKRTKDDILLPETSDCDKTGIDEAFNGGQAHSSFNNVTMNLNVGAENVAESSVILMERNCQCVEKSVELPIDDERVRLIDELQGCIDDGEKSLKNENASIEELKKLLSRCESVISNAKLIEPQMSDDFNLKILKLQFIANSVRNERNRCMDVKVLIETTAQLLSNIESALDKVNNNLPFTFEEAELQLIALKDYKDDIKKLKRHESHIKLIVVDLPILKQIAITVNKYEIVERKLEHEIKEEKIVICEYQQIMDELDEVKTYSEFEELERKASKLNRIRSHTEYIQPSDRIQELQEKLKSYRQKFEHDISNERKCRQIQILVHKIQKQHKPKNKSKKKRPKQKTATAISSIDRAAQINNLEVDIAELQDHILPTIDQINAEIEASHLDKRHCEEQRSRTVNLINTLKAELDTNEKEQQNVDQLMALVEQVQQVTTESPILENMKLIDYIEDIDGAKKVLADAESKRKQAKDLIEKLHDTKETITQLAEPENSQVEKCENDAKNVLKEADEKLNDAQKQISALERLLVQRGELNAQLSDINIKLNTINENCQTPQSLSIAEDNLRRTNDINFRAAGIEKQLNNFGANSMKVFTADDSKIFTAPLKEEVEKHKMKVRSLMMPLTTKIDQAKQLQAEKNAIAHDLDNLNNRVKRVHDIADVNEKSAEMSALKKDVEFVRAKFIKLKESVIASGTVLAVKDEEFDSLQQNLDALIQALNSEERDAAKRVANMIMSAKLSQEIQHIQDGVEKAKMVNSDPNTSEEDLRRAIAIVDELIPHFRAIQDATEVIDKNDSEANALVSIAMDQHAKQGEDFAVLLRSLNDRLENLKRFHEMAKDVENQLVRMKNQALNIEMLSDASEMEKIQDDLNNIATQQLVALRKVADDLQPLFYPTFKVEDLIKLQQQLEFKIKQELSAHAFDKQLNALELKRIEAAEHIAYNFEQMHSEDIEKCINEKLLPLQVELKQLTLVAPSDELEERRCKLSKSIFTLLNDAESNKEEFIKQQEFSVKLEKEISNYEVAVSSMINRYDNLQPYEKANDDINLLRTMNEAISALPLDEMKDKIKREMLRSRLQPLNNQACEFIFFLTNGRERQTKISDDSKKLTEELNNLASSLTKICDAGELKNLLQFCSKFFNELPQLKRRVEDLKSLSCGKEKEVLQAPTSTPTLADLVNKLESLENEVEKAKSFASHKQQLQAIVPQVEQLKSSVQTKVDRIDYFSLMPLSEQEDVLRTLEAEKQKMMALLDEIPDTHDACPVRESGNFELSRLSDLIKSLAAAVGDKVAALTAFLAAKFEIDSQLQIIGEQVEKQQDYREVPLNANNLNALKEQRKKIKKLCETLNEAVKADNLDDENRKELDRLNNALEFMNEKINEAQRNVEQSILLQAASDELKERLASKNKQLVLLIDESRHALNDAAAIPKTYEQMSAKLETVVADAQNFAAEHECPEALQENILQANSVMQLLKQRWCDWLSFIEQKQLANQQLDAARKPLDEIEVKGIRLLSEAQQDLVNLIDGQNALVPLRATIERLDKLCDRLEPVEATYADLRFLDVDYEQAEKQYVSMLAILGKEINEESKLCEAVHQICTKLSNAEEVLRGDQSDFDLLQKYQLHTLPELAKELSELKRIIQLSAHNRKQVKSAIKEDDFKTHLKEIVRRFDDKINKLQKEKEEAQITVLQKKLTGAEKLNVDEEEILLLAREIDALPYQHPMVMELQQKIGNLQKNMATKKEAEKKTKEKMDWLMERLRNLHTKHGKQVDKKSKKKRPKQKTATAISSIDRAAQINNLKVDIAELQDHILPTIDQINAEIEASHLDKRHCEEQRSRTVNLINTLKAELDTNEKEQQNVDQLMALVEQVQQVTTESPILENMKLIDYIEDIDGAKKVLADAESKRKQAKDLIEKLHDTKETITQLAEPENSQVEKCENDAKNVLKEADEKLNDAQKQISALERLLVQRGELNAQLSDINIKLNTINENCQTPQSLSIAEDNLRRTNDINFRAAGIEKQLNNFGANSMKVFTADDSKIFTAPLKEEVEKHKMKVRSLMMPLTTKIDQAKQLQAEKNAIAHDLDNLNNRVKRVHDIADVNEKSAEMSALKKDVEFVRAKFIKLKESVIASGTVLAVKDEEFDSLQQNLDALIQALNSEERDAAKRVANMIMSAKLSQEIQHIQDGVEKAKMVNSDPNTSEEDLRRAIAIVDELIPHFRAIQDATEVIDKNDSEANALVSIAMDQHAKQGEDFAVLLRSLNDRLENLKRFHEMAKDVENQLVRMKNQALNIEMLSDASEMEKIQDDLNNIATQQLVALRKVADDLQPLFYPTFKVEDLIKLQQQLEFKIKQELSAHAFDKQLNALELKRIEAAEHIAYNFEQMHSEDIEKCINEKLLPLQVELKQLTLVAPSDELEERRCKLSKSIFTLLNDAESNKEEFIKQQEFSVKLEKEISNYEVAVSSMINRYDNLQPYEKANDDINLLRTMNEAISALPLDEMKDKIKREMLRSRLQPLNNQACEFIFFLTNGRERQTKISDDSKKLTEELNNLASSLTKICDAGELKNLLQFCSKFFNELPQLKRRVEDLKSLSCGKEKEVLQAPTSTPTLADLVNKLESLENEVEKAKSFASHKQQLQAIVPQVEQLKSSVQTKVDRIDYFSLMPLSEQEDVLRTLEAEKQKMMALLDEIPDTHDACPVRESGNFELSRLSDLIKSLAAAVGDKVAALTAFLAAKFEIDSQLQIIGEQVEKQQDYREVPLNANNLNALKEQRKKIKKLCETLNEAVKADNLDDENRKELDRLNNALEFMNEKINEAQRNVEQSILLQAASDELKERLASKNKQLVLLIDESRHALNDAAAIPKTYEQMSAKLETVVADAQNFAAEHECPEALQENILQANSVMQLLKQRWCDWLSFIEQKQLANQQLDAARKPLDEIEVKGIRLLSEAQQDLVNLIDGQNALVPLRATIERLDKLCDRLEPVEATYADLRFLDVDYEQAEKQYVSMLAILGKEINEESKLCEAVHQICTKLSNAEEVLRGDQSDFDLLQKYQLHTLPELAKELSELKRIIQLSAHNRKQVKSAIKEDDFKTHLKEIVRRFDDKINKLQKEKEEAQITVLQKKLTGAEKLNVDEEEILLLAREIDALPYQHPMVMELQQKIGNLQKNMATKKEAEKKTKEKMDWLMERLRNLHTKHGKQVDKKSKKKRPKQKTATAISSIDRAAQINNLKVDIAELQDHILPTIDQINAEIEASHLDKRHCEEQRSRTVNLINTLKAELDTNEKEQQNVDQLMALVEQVQQVTTESPILENMKLIDYIEDIDGAKKVLADAESKRKQAKDLIEKLHDTKETITQLAEPENSQVEKCENDAKNVLKEADEKLNDAQKQISALERLLVQRGELNAQLSDINIKLNTINENCQTPQSLSIAEDNLRRTNDINFRAAGIEKQLNNFGANSMKVFTADDSKIFTAPLKEEVEKHKMKVRSLMMPLTTKIDQAKQLQAEKNAIAHDLDNLNNRVKRVHDIADVNEKSAEMSALKKDVEFVRAKFIKLKESVIASGTVLAVKDEEFDSLQQNLDALIQALNSEERDAAKRVANMIMSAKLSQEIQHIQDGVEKAKMVNSDPNTSEEDLRRAIAIVDELIPHFRAIQDATEVIDKNDSEANALVSIAMDQHAKQGEDFAVLLRSLNDRLENLKRFHEMAKDVENQLVRMKNQALNIEMLSDASEMEKIQDDLNNIATQQLVALRKVADDLQPLFYPTFKVEDLIKLQQQLEFKIKQELSAHAFDKQLNALELKRIEAAEHIAYNFEQMHSEDIEKCINEKLLPLQVELKQLTLVAPSDELEERRCKLSKSIFTLLNDAESNKEEFIKQQEFSVKLEKEISNYEVAVSSMINRYDNLQPYEKANDDINLLRTMNEAISALPLDEMKDKIKREMLRSRLQPLNNQACEFIFFLTNGRERQTKISDDSKKLTEELNNLASSLTKICDAGELKNLLQFCSKFFNELPQLKRRVEDLKSLSCGKEKEVLQAPTSTPTLADLVNKLESLENEVEKAKSFASHKQQLQAIVPQVEQLKSSVQTKVDRIDYFSLMPLSEQEDVLRTLEAEKQKMMALLDEIPDTHDACPVRESGNFELSRLSDLIKSLAAAVGDKVAALTAFLAAKFEIDSQLQIIGEQVEKQQDYREVPLNANNLNALKEQRKKIKKLCETLNEAVKADNLDDENRKELDRLNNALEFMNEKINEAQRNVEQSILLQAASDELKERLASKNKQLVLLIDESRHALNDAAAIPKTYEQMSAKLETVVADAQNFAAEHECPEALQENILQANSVMQLLKQRWCDWLSFIEQKQLANQQLDAARKPLDLLVVNTCVNLEAGKSMFDSFKGNLECLQPIRNLLGELEEIGEKLAPLSTISHDIRFLVVELENLQLSYEDLLNGLLYEVSQEEEFRASIDELKLLINSAKNRLDECIELNDQEKLMKLKVEVNNLRSHFVELISDIEATGSNRNYVSVDTFFLKEELDAGLMRLEQNVQSAIEELQHRLSQLGNTDADQPMSSITPANNRVIVSELSDPTEYDIDAAAEVFAAIFRDQQPRHVLREHGLDELLDLESSDSSCYEQGSDDIADVDMENVDAALYVGSSTGGRTAPRQAMVEKSPLQEMNNVNYLRQRSRWKQVLRTALPLQAMLVLLLGAACLVPQCDDNYCCHLLNNFARSFDAQLDFINGPPPI